MNLVFNRLLIFDGSHCLHRNLCEPHLWEMKNIKGERTGGIYGTLQTILKESSSFNYFPVVVFDGHLSKRRLDIFPNYKRTLDKQLLLENEQNYLKREEKGKMEEFKNTIMGKITKGAIFEWGENNEKGEWFVPTEEQAEAMLSEGGLKMGENIIDYSSNEKARNGKTYAWPFG